MAKNGKSFVASPPDGLKISVSGPGRLSALLPVSRRELATIADRILKMLDLPSAGVEIRLMGDQEMAELNHSSFGVHAPTNVLSFPEQEGVSFGHDVLGLIALSVETLDREIFLYGQDPREHVIRLLAHSILHLSGLEHGHRMERLTEQAVLLAHSPSEPF